MPESSRTGKKGAKLVEEDPKFQIIITPNEISIDNNGNGGTIMSNTKLMKKNTGLVPLDEIYGQQSNMQSRDLE